MLEIGPCQGALHIELRRRVPGPVDIVERSGRFTEALRRRCRRDGFGAGEVWECDLIDAPLPQHTYDLIFARWVFLFLPDVDALLGKLVTALKPGGRLAVEDYCRGTLRMVPEAPEWNDFLQADLGFFASQGGDANVGARLPELYRHAGLDVVDVTPTTKVGRPGSREWEWMSTYFVDILPRYGRFRPFTSAKATSLRRHWLAAARRKTSLLISPTVLDIVGRKPMRGR